MTKKLTTKQKRKYLEGVPHVCAYCGISEDECRDYFDKHPRFSRGGHRGKTLEVDKIDSSKNYDTDNVNWACYICNNCKSNYINSVKDFEPIAKGIHEFWKEQGYNPVSPVTNPITSNGGTTKHNP